MSQAQRAEFSYDYIDATFSQGKLIVTDSANLRKVFNYISILHKVEILKSEFHAKPLILKSYDSSKCRTSSAFLPARVQFFKQARDFDV